MTTLHVTERYQQRSPPRGWKDTLEQVKIDLKADARPTIFIPSSHKAPPSWKRIAAKGWGKVFVGQTADQKMLPLTSPPIARQQKEKKEMEENITRKRRPMTREQMMIETSHLLKDSDVMMDFISLPVALRKHAMKCQQCTAAQNQRPE